MLTFFGRYKTQIISASASLALASVWLAFVFIFQPDGVGSLATAVATACVISLIQNHYKDSK
jgi:uncharacterized membrane-anchored protein YitT (DUF2179 family)